MSAENMNCPKCLKELHEGYKGLLWCLCGYKLYPPDYKEKPDHNLLREVFK